MLADIHGAAKPYIKRSFGFSRAIKAGTVAAKGRGLSMQAKVVSRHAKSNTTQEGSIKIP